MKIIYYVHGTTTDNASKKCSGWKQAQLNDLGRLNFLMEETEENILFYYYLNDKKDIADFIKELEEAGIKTKKRKVDLSPENL